jgi:hypothetical protein
MFPTTEPLPFFFSNWRPSQLVKAPLIENPKKPHMIPTTYVYVYFWPPLKYSWSPTQKKIQNKSKTYKPPVL